jgi:hypothetical protein
VLILFPEDDQNQLRQLHDYILVSRIVPAMGLMRIK